jgi:hypothetical protein
MTTFRGVRESYSCERRTNRNGGGTDCGKSAAGGVGRLNRTWKSAKDDFTRSRTRAEADWNLKHGSG